MTRSRRFARGAWSGSTPISPTALPFSARITTIADANGSSDGTWSVALALAEELPGVRAVRLDQRGRGRALYTVWSESDAAVLAYMDVDLSTDLAARCSCRSSRR